MIEIISIGAISRRQLQKLRACISGSKALQLLARRAAGNERKITLAEAPDEMPLPSLGTDLS